MVAAETTAPATEKAPPERGSVNHEGRQEKGGNSATHPQDNTTETVAQHSQHSEAGTNCYVHKLLRTRPQQTADTNGMGTTHPMMVPAVGFDPATPGVQMLLSDGRGRSTIRCHVAPTVSRAEANAW